MRVGLLAMPWRNPLLPSHQIASLLSVARQSGAEAAGLHLYLDVAAEWGLERYQTWYGRLRHEQLHQEALYAGLLFPERRVTTGPGDEPLPPGFWPEWEAAHDAAFARHDWAAFDLIVCVANGVVSSPATQFLADIEAARRIKKSAPHVRVVLAGPDTMGEIGRSVLATVEGVDGVINGEIEPALSHLLNQGGQWPPAPFPGLLVRGAETTGPVTSTPPVPDLDALPVPDYDAFFAHPLASSLPDVLLRMETARGCWWDRSAKDPRLSCQFCNINVAGGAYRRKSIDRVLADLQTLCERYPGRRWGFTDTITWPDQAADLFAAIADAGHGITLHGLEAHASLDRAAIWQMKRAGVRSLQLGIEAFSSSLLRRMNKGVAFHRLIETLRHCAELGIKARGNLIVDYPGSTPDEVTETLARLQQVTWLPPLEVSVLAMGYNSPLHRRAADAGIAEVRNATTYGTLLPPEWLQGLELMHKSCLPPDTGADWSPVVMALETWQRRWKESPVALRRYYIDQPPGDPGALVLVAFDDGETPTRLRLTGTQRRLFLYCLEARRLTAIETVFGDLGSDGLRATLDAWEQAGFIMQADDRYLSLGLAGSPALLERLQPRSQAAPAPAPRLTLRPNPVRASQP